MLLVAVVEVDLNLLIEVITKLEQDWHVRPHDVAKKLNIYH